MILQQRLKQYFSSFRVSHAVLIYAIIRILSFVTYTHASVNALIGAGLIIGFAFLCIKKLPLAWIFLVSEFLLDGSGHFFEIGGYIFRTWILGMFALAWAWSIWKEKKIPLPQKRFRIPLILVLVAVVWSVIHGFLQGHSTILILQDAILYFFLLLLFPAIHVKSDIQTYFPILIKGYIAGSAIFSAMTLSIYASGIGTLPDTYYHWFRNVAAGKITDLGNNFFRIVLPEHLFLVPIILVLAAYTIRRENIPHLWWYQLSALFVLTLNFTRIYILAVVVGLLVLVIHHSFVRWLSTSIQIGATTLLMFSSLFLITSHGNSLGLDVLVGRASGVISPGVEVSGITRLALLPDIMHTITQHPFIGSGLGATVTYQDPVQNREVTRTQFDWGYLEMLAELGIIGLTIFLLFLIHILIATAKHAYQSPVHAAPYRGLFAGGIALCIINITTPSLFYGFGILFFVLLLFLLEKQAPHTS